MILRDDGILFSAKKKCAMKNEGEGGGRDEEEIMCFVSWKDIGEM